MEHDTVEYSLRIDALNRACEVSSPSTAADQIVEKAEKFYQFLRGNPTDSNYRRAKYENDLALSKAMIVADMPKKYYDPFKE